MDLMVKKSALFLELQYVQGIIERRTTVPVLSNVLLETSGNAVIVTATDLDVSIRCSCPANVKVSGGMALSARKLFDLVRLLPDSDVHLKSVSEDRIQIHCERSRFKLPGLSKSSFPEIPTVAGKTTSLPAGALRYLIQQSIFAVTQEETRYALNSGLLIVNPVGVTLVTTDGHRLVVVSYSCEVSGMEGESRCLVPRKTLLELSKLIPDDLESIDFGRTENHLFFSLAERLLVSRVPSGQFPNYEMVIPRENDKQVVLNTREFLDALKRVAIMADEESHGIRFNLKTGLLDISSTNPNYGEAKESLPVEYEGDSLEIGFNSNYLLDFLSGVASQEVTLDLRDKDTQGLFRPKDLEHYAHEYVVMPMNV